MCLYCFYSNRHIASWTCGRVVDSVTFLALLTSSRLNRAGGLHTFCAFASLKCFYFTLTNVFCLLFYSMCLCHQFTVWQAKIWPAESIKNREKHRDVCCDWKDSSTGTKEPNKQNTKISTIFFGEVVFLCIVWLGGATCMWFFLFLFFVFTMQFWLLWHSIVSYSVGNTIQPSLCKRFCLRVIFCDCRTTAYPCRWCVLTLRWILTWLADYLPLSSDIR